MNIQIFGTKKCFDTKKAEKKVRVLLADGSEEDFLGANEE